MSVSKSFRLVACVSALALLVVSIACNGGGSGSTNGSVSLQGAGASFPNPLYQKWMNEYGKVKPSVKLDYQSIGSGGGIKQLKEQTVDFGASDAPMKDEDLKSAPGEILHVPTVLGAVTITYNLQGVSQPLRFSPEVIADIFLGKTKKWNDPKIAADNPGVTLPASDIWWSIVLTAAEHLQSSLITFQKSVPSGKKKSAPALRRVGPSVSAAKVMKV